MHNLKRLLFIDAALPRNKFIVITGFVGVEANLPWPLIHCMQKANIEPLCESLSAYARQFLGREKPKVELYQRDFSCYC